MPSCFLAYRKANASLRDRLTNAILALRNDDFLFEFWTDNHLLPGDVWEKVIATRIDEADIFFLLVTTEYSPNSYAIETELARAIARAKANQPIRIVPIIADNIIGLLGQAEIEEFRYNALPAGGRGLSQYGDTSEWLAAVVAGIKRLILHELAGEQLSALNLIEEIEQFRSHVELALSCVDTSEGALGRFTSLVRYALMRALDVLDVGPEAFASALLPVRQKINEARRAAREVGALHVETALRDVGVSIDDLQDAATQANEGGTPAEPVFTAFLAADDVNVAGDRMALQARLTSVEMASEALEEIELPVASAEEFLNSAGRQMGAESRIAQTVLRGRQLEANAVSSAVGQLARTVAAVTQQAPRDLPAAASEIIGDTKHHTENAVRYAERIFARAHGLSVPAAPPPIVSEELPPAVDEAAGITIPENADPFAYVTPQENSNLGTLAALAPSDVQYAYEIGTRFELGRGVRRSPAIARAFYRYAGRNGYARAWNRLDRMERRLG